MDGGHDLSKLPSWMRTPSGYNCRAPYEYEYQSEAFVRQCGHCPRCVARKKRDISGRCAAEAYTSPEVVVWTLTYAPLEPFPVDGRPWVQERQWGAVDFITKHRQDFLKRVRDFLYRKARKQVGAPKRMPSIKPRIDQFGEVHPAQHAAHVRAYWKHKIAEVLPVIKFMGCGERGKRRTKRCHWHLVLFMSKVSGFISTPPDPDGTPGRENHDLWPYGFVNIHVLSHDIEPKMKAVRYAVKYLDKSRSPGRAARLRGEQSEAKFFRSLSRPLGWQYLTDLARHHAQTAVPVHGVYTVPGVRFSRGRTGGPGDLVKHTVLGRMREHYIEAFRDEWEKQRPHIEIPMTEFMLRFDQEAAMKTSPHIEAREAERRKRWNNDRGAFKPAPRTTNPKKDRSGCLALQVPGVGFAGMVQLLYSGFAQFVAPDGIIYPVPNGNVRDLVSMDHAAHCKVEAWIAERRGPEWLSRRERALRKYERHLAQVEAIRKWAKKGPKALPDHVHGALEPLTALHRKLALKGMGHVPGTVVTDPGGKLDPETGKLPAYIRPRTGLLKPIQKRIP